MDLERNEGADKYARVSSDPGRFQADAYLMSVLPAIPNLPTNKKVTREARCPNVETIVSEDAFVTFMHRYPTFIV